MGECRNSTGNLGTDKLFTGQRLDDTGLYYYGARYYDPTIGRFISPDTIVPDFTNPQAFNRYSYVLNNPLKYTDPSGHFWDWFVDIVAVVWDVVELVREPSWENAGYLATDIGLGILPFVPAGVGFAARTAKTTARVLNRADDVGDISRAASKIDDVADVGGSALKALDDVTDTGKSIIRASDDIIDASKGYDSFNAFKSAQGPAGEGKVYHHIVEQSQIQKSGFDPKVIHNPDNIVAVDQNVHAQISGFYSSKQSYTGGQIVRDWLSGQSLQTQYEFGVQKLIDFGAIR